MATLPLAGRRILLTRASHQLSEPAGQVRRLGGVPVLFPCLKITPLTGPVALALEQLQPEDDILFTSANGVWSVARTADDLHTPMPRLLAGHRIAAVGRSTAACLARLGIEPAIIPQTQSQQGLIEAYEQAGPPRRLVFFRAEEGSDALADHLRGHGCEVRVVPAYRSECAHEDPAPVIAMLRRGEIDAVLLGSSKTAQCYAQRIGDSELAGTPLIVAISRQVADAATAAGLDVRLVAKEASFAAMLQSLVEFYDTQGAQ